MPSHKEHCEQAKHNHDLLKFLETHDREQRFRDWYVTIAYYAALHYFEAILPVIAPEINKKRQLHFIKLDYDDHYERLDVMRAEFQDIYFRYSSLYNRSRAAKYKRYAVSSYVVNLTKRYLEDVIVECAKAIKRFNS